MTMDIGKATDHWVMECAVFTILLIITICMPGSNLIVLQCNIYTCGIYKGIAKVVPQLR